MNNAIKTMLHRRKLSNYTVQERARYLDEMLDKELSVYQRMQTFGFCYPEIELSEYTYLNIGEWKTEGNHNLLRVRKISRLGLRKGDAPEGETCVHYKTYAAELGSIGYGHMFLRPDKKLSVN